MKHSKRGRYLLIYVTRAGVCVRAHSTEKEGIYVTATERTGEKCGRDGITIRRQGEEVQNKKRSVGAYGIPAVGTRGTIEDDHSRDRLCLRQECRRLLRLPDMADRGW